MTQVTIWHLSLRVGRPYLTLAAAIAQSLPTPRCCRADERPPGRGQAGDQICGKYSVMTWTAAATVAANDPSRINPQAVAEFSASFASHRTSRSCSFCRANARKPTANAFRARPVAVVLPDPVTKRTRQRSLIFSLSASVARSLYLASSALAWLNEPQRTMNPPPKTNQLAHIPKEASDITPHPCHHRPRISGNQDSRSVTLDGAFRLKLPSLGTSDL
jgi:hypothetical protein